MLLQHFQALPVGPQPFQIPGYLSIVGLAHDHSGSLNLPHQHTGPAPAQTFPAAEAPTFSGATATQHPIDSEDAANVKHCTAIGAIIGQSTSALGDRPADGPWQPAAERIQDAGS